MRWNCLTKDDSAVESRPVFRADCISTDCRSNSGVLGFWQRIDDINQLETSAFGGAARGCVLGFDQHPNWGQVPIISDARDESDSARGVAVSAVGFVYFISGVTENAENLFIIGEANV